MGTIIDARAILALALFFSALPVRAATPVGAANWTASGPTNSALKGIARVSEVVATNAYTLNGVRITAWPSGGGAPSGTMVKSGSYAVGDIPAASDTTGTNYVKATSANVQNLLGQVYQATNSNLTGWSVIAPTSQGLQNTLGAIYQATNSNLTGWSVIAPTSQGVQNTLGQVYQATNSNLTGWSAIAATSQGIQNTLGQVYQATNSNLTSWSAIAPSAKQDALTGTANQVIITGTTLSTPQDIATTSGPTFASVTAAIKQKGPVFDITAYGADGSGTTTTVSSWNDSTHAVVADASSFSVGQYIAINRAGAIETTGNTSAGSGTISSVASTNGFAVNDYIRVVAGQAAQAQVREITVQVAGNAGDVVSTELNGVIYRYTVQAGDTAVAVATGLAAAITGDATISASSAQNVVSITAASAGTAFTYNNIRPYAQNPIENVRTKLTYRTSAANIPATDVIVRITAVGATSFTVTPVVPSATTGTRIERLNNRLITTITGKSSNTLTIADAATTLATGVTVYHDSSAALLAAISAAGSGIVFVPDGTFHVLTPSVVAFGSASLVGLGKGVSVIKATGWAVGSRLRWAATANGGANFILQDFTLDLEGNAYMGQTGSAIQIGTFSATGYNTNIVLSGVQILNVPGAGARIYNARNAIVTKCHVKNTGSDGVTFGLYDNGSSVTYQESFDIWFTDNLVEESNHIGAMTYGDSSTAGSYTVGAFRNVHVNRNTFRHCALLGWEFYTGSYDSEFVGNTVEYCGGWESMWANGSVNDHGGIAVKYSQNILVEANAIRNSYRAIEVFGRTNNATLGYVMTKAVKVLGNLVTDCYIGVNASEGIYGLEIANNQLNTFQDAAIVVAARDTQYWPIRNVSIPNNYVGNGRYGLVIGAGVNDVEILDNVFDSNNGWEESAANKSGVVLNLFGDGTYYATNIVVRMNRFVDTRVGPTNAQINAVYGDYVKQITLKANYASGNKTNSYGLTANASLTTSTMNTWDGEGYLGETVTGSGGLVKATSPTITTPAITSGSLTAPTVIGRTWATISGTTPTAGTIDYATDIGTNGVALIYNGTRWKALNGRATINKVGAPQSGVANSATIVLQALIPAGAWKDNDTIRIWCDLTKSGATDTCVVSVRIGTAGTTGDTAVVNGSTFISAANRAWTGFLDFKLLSATSVQKVGSGNNVSTGAGTASTAAASPVTISSAASNPLYVSLIINSSSTNDTVGIDDGSIELLTP